MVKKKLRILEDGTRTLTTYYRFKKRFPNVKFNRKQNVYNFIGTKEEDIKETKQEKGNTEYVYSVKMSYSSNRHPNEMHEVTTTIISEEEPTKDEVIELTLSNLPQDYLNQISTNLKSVDVSLDYSNSTKEDKGVDVVNVKYPNGIF